MNRRIVGFSRRRDTVGAKFFRASSDIQLVDQAGESRFTIRLPGYPASARACRMSSAITVMAGQPEYVGVMVTITIFFQRDILQYPQLPETDCRDLGILHRIQQFPQRWQRRVRARRRRSYSSAGSRGMRELAVTRASYHRSPG